MKKTIFTGLIALLCAAQALHAIPAKPGKFVKIQPDGTKITLQRHGDEFYHWTTDENGNVMAPDAKGLYQPASMPTQERLGGRAAANAAAAAIRAQRAAAQTALKAGGSYTTYHFPVILVQFTDQEFESSTAQQDFYRLLNEEGYSDNGGTGSVHDFYWENSMETFYAIFDVYGPYTYKGKVADYADEDDAATLLWAAIQAYDSTIDWSQYDNDGDGTVDMVFMYYAGWNEAEGEDDTIWPHKYDFYHAGVTAVQNTTLDGMYFSVYACTSERKGTSSADGGMCGIGTCAHEFSHTQGLPDFYDVNYNNYGDGTAGATYAYDIMCSGGYNNEGRTPPYFNAEERVWMGWMNGLTTLPSDGDITVPAINSNFAYKMQSSNVNTTAGDEEYFIFETRPGTGWDAPLEPGLLVYHVDKSSTYTISFYMGTSIRPSMTGYNLWNRGTFTYTIGQTAYTDFTQYINANGSHPCFYIVPAADQSNLNYGGSEAKLPFPGTGNVRYYCPQDWAGNSYDLFTDITFHSDGSSYGYDDPVVTLHRGDNYKGICGTVTNSSGEKVSGADVSIYATSSTKTTSNTIQKISGRILDNLMYSVKTDENGYYSFDLSSLDNTTVDIEVVAKGYITKYVSVEVSDQLITKDFTLRGIDEAIDYTLKKYQSLSPLYLNGYGSTCTNYLSLRFTADELEDYVGRKILKLGFAYSLDDDASVSSVYGLIDFGTTRKLTSKVSSPEAYTWNVVDVSSENLYIPDGEDCYFGYALVRCTDGYPWLYSADDPQDGGLNYYLTSSTSISTSAVTWTSFSGGNLLVYVELDDSSEVDYNYIKNPGYGTYSVGDTFDLTLIEADGDRKPGSEIKWYYDDELVATSSAAASGQSITFKYAGYHVIEARFTTTEGKTKIVELELNVGL